MLIARRYLASFKRSGIDTLVLGCTHYPFLKGVVCRVMGPGVRLIDSAQETAREAERLLSERGLLRPTGRGRSCFFVSDDPERFLKLARRLIGRRIGRVRRHALD